MTYAIFDAQSNGRVRAYYIHAHWYTYTTYTHAYIHVCVHIRVPRLDGRGYGLTIPLSVSLPPLRIAGAAWREREVRDDDGDGEVRASERDALRSRG